MFVARSSGTHTTSLKANTRRGTEVYFLSGAWLPAGTHAEPLYIYIYFFSAFSVAVSKPWNADLASARLGVSHRRRARRPLTRGIFAAESTHGASIFFGTGIYFDIVVVNERPPRVARVSLVYSSRIWTVEGFIIWSQYNLVVRADSPVFVREIYARVNCGQSSRVLRIWTIEGFNDSSFIGFSIGRNNWQSRFRVRDLRIDNLLCIRGCEINNNSLPGTRYSLYCTRAPHGYLCSGWENTPQR